MTKVCVRCNIEKNIIKFHRNKSEKDGYCRWCAECFNKARRQEYRQIKQKRDRLYYQKNSEIIKARSKKWFKENKPHVMKHKKLRRKNDINYKLADYLRSRMNKAVKGNWKSGSAVSDLGCSIEEFKNYIANKFTVGMTWENYGKWHLDHIKSLNTFDLSDREQFLKAAHYTNYQPLWALDNIRKNRKI